MLNLAQSGGQIEKRMSSKEKVGWHSLVHRIDRKDDRKSNLTPVKLGGQGPDDRENTHTRVVPFWRNFSDFSSQLKIVD